MHVTDPARVESLLRWYLEAGVDETVGEQALDRYQAGESPATIPPALTVDSQKIRPADEPTTQKYRHTVESEPQVAVPAAAQSLDELRRALEVFEGCPLSRTATNLVFGDGSAHAKVVLIGEAPGAEEDRQGLPFVGPSGRLLDRMLASIGLDRSTVFISNTVFWRPPGNRAPTSQEIAVCMPFVERIIELISPRLLVALGGPAAAALLGEKESVGRLSGRWFTYQTARMDLPVPSTALYHPAYLLRSPAQKRLAWRDLLTIKKRLSAEVAPVRPGE